MSLAGMFVCDTCGCFVPIDARKKSPATAVIKGVSHCVDGTDCPLVLWKKKSSALITKFSTQHSPACFII